MSLDDLRARLHDINKRTAALANDVDRLTVDLQNYQPTEPTPSPVKIRFGQHLYDNWTPIDLSVFDVYDLQRGWPANTRLKPDGELYLYATIVRRPSDPHGLTQFLQPGQVPNGWCAHTPDGKSLVTRDRGDGPENLINIAVAQWRALAVSTIVDEVVTYDATGLYVDEVDQWFKYAWTQIASTGAKEFTSEGYWRSMWLTFLEQLATALHNRGKKLWVNLGADYDLTDPWQRAIVDTVDAVNIEFYTGREGVNAGPTTLSDGWLSQNSFVAAVEKLGKPVHVHCSSLNQRVVDYAFCSWLLHTEFVGSFSASRDYGGVTASSPLFGVAKGLGAPLGKVTTNGPIRSRRFEGGTVHVNPTSTPDVALPAMTGLIELR